ncbi:MAG TPA: ABC transporter permease [Pyrinomonadaceae bacterium]|nr:ABC transporter permease [Pyrinomonadaceae bacterium]
MKNIDLIKIANRNLLRAKLRTFLTIMAIFVGSFTLVMTNGLGDGLKDYVEKQVKNIEGKNILTVRRQVKSDDDEKQDPNKVPEYKEQSNTAQEPQFNPNDFQLTLAEMETLAKEFPEVKSITPFYQIDADYITLDGQKKYIVALGMLSDGYTQKTEAGKTIDGEGQILIPLMLARTMDENIDNLIGKTASIGYKVGENEQVKTLPLRIVGVSTKGFMSNFNSFVDTKTAKRLYDEQQAGSPDHNKFSHFTFLLNNATEAKFNEIKKKLGEKGFEAMTVADREKRTYDAIGILQIGLNLFAFIALLAASFGIINTLVIAVLERTKEIGLQKALGMGRGKIFALFAFESILIGFWGALSGIIGGMIVGFVANLVLATAYKESFEGYSLFVFTIPSLLFVMFLVCIIAFFAGVLPAFKASRLNPIEALRYE